MQANVKQQIDRLKSKGALYADARVYPYEQTNELFMINGNLKGVADSRSSGIGVRVLYNGAWGFSASSDMSDLAGLFDRAFDNARVASERVTFPIRLAEKEAVQAAFTS